ncbi:MAG: hypothetical protein HUU26_11705, partial [Gemmatimonadaceae bacterium]|nr:hypothetical protein [Gemmatimonadaceae bacterium]
RGGRGAGAPPPARGAVRIPNLAAVQGELMTLYGIIEDSDNAPTTQVTTAARTRLAQARTALQAVRRLATVIQRQ